MGILLLIIVISTAGIASTWYLLRAAPRREGRRLANAIQSTEAIFQCLDRVPNNLINRDLRRCTVLLLSHHLEVLRDIQPRHPHLLYIESRQQRLNRIPTGLERRPIRTKKDRREAALALEELAGIIKKGARAKAVNARDADLGAAAALFAAQQIAVETARQAAKDAENVRAYQQALNFAYQAEALCRRLPPLMGKALTESVSADVERLEQQLGRPARI